MLTVQEIRQLLHKGEGTHIEFKEAQDGVPATLYDTVSSFLNKEGGIILLGITDDGNILGLEGANLMQLKQNIVTALNNPDVINPPYALPVGEAGYKGLNILYIRVPVSSLVHKHCGIIYNRENDSDIRITDDRQISEIYFRKRQNFSETQIFPALNLELKDIANYDLLVMKLVKFWEEKCGELQGVRFLIKNDVEIEVLKNVGSWEEKSEELLKKRGRVILSTLLLTLSPTTLEELANILEYKSKERYRDDYVKPLKDNNLIAYTIPDTPNDPNQAYVVTQRGKDLIGGHLI